MSDTKETGDKMLRTAPPVAGGAAAAGARKTLTLTRTVEQGAVRQTFGQGRSKSVQVEVKKTRKLAKPGSPDEAGEQGTTQHVSRLGGLSNSEMDKRLKALEAAKEREVQEAKTGAEAEERRRLADAEVAAMRAAQTAAAQPTQEPSTDTKAVAAVAAPRAGEK